jgi:hypothetical protein
LIAEHRQEFRSGAVVVAQTLTSSLRGRIV